MLSLNIEISKVATVLPVSAILQTAGAPILRFVRMFNRAVETDIFLAATVVVAGLLVVAIAAWYLEVTPTTRRRIRRLERQHYTLKGSTGQTIGSLKMNDNQDIESFVEDLTALNQIVRGGEIRPSARLEVTQLRCLREEAQEYRTQYSSFSGSLCTGLGCVPVQGLAKIRCRKDMIVPEVEFESTLGKFRIELPEIPRVLGSRSLKFNVDIGVSGRQTQA